MCAFKFKILKISLKIFFQLTKASSRDESNCSNEENECPPIIDRSTIERPQIEVLYKLIVFLRFDLPKCHPFWSIIKFRIKIFVFLLYNI